MGIIRKTARYVSSSINYLNWLAISPYKFKKVDYKGIKRALIVNTGFIGDLLATTPLIEKLSDSGIRVDVLIKSDMNPLVENNDNINKILVYSDSDIIADEIRKERYDLAVLIHPNDKKIARLLAQSGVKYRIADVPSGIFGFYDILFNKIKTPQFSEDKHKVIQNLEFAKMIGLKLGEVNPRNNPMKLEIEKKEIAKTRKKFSLKRGFAVMSSGSRSQIKMGIELPSAEKFAVIADYIAENYKLNVILLGSKDEFYLCDEIIKNSKNKGKIKNLSGKTTLEELVSIIKSADLVVGIDSGVIHIAASENKRIVDLMRKSQEKIWYPWTNKEDFVLLVSDSENLNNIGEKEIKRAIDSLLR